MDKNRIYLGDFREVLSDLEDDSVDAFIADPPYPREYTPLYLAMFDLAAKKLKRGGSLLTILPHYNLPGLISYGSVKLKWRWMMCMWQKDGPHPRMAMGIEVLWKPLGWWVKGAWKMGRGFVVDGFENDPKFKPTFNWEQSETWAEYCVKKFTREGDLIVDPMCGAGTVPFVCKQNNRDFIGVEIDEKRFDIAKNRVLKMI